MICRKGKKVVARASSSVSLAAKNHENVDSVRHHHGRLAILILIDILIARALIRCAEVAQLETSQIRKKLPSALH